MEVGVGIVNPDSQIQRSAIVAKRKLASAKSGSRSTSSGERTPRASGRTHGGHVTMVDVSEMPSELVSEQTVAMNILVPATIPAAEYHVKCDQ